MTFNQPMAYTAIIIVNYCTAGLTIDCLASLARDRLAGKEFSVVLVDNASPDDSVEVLTKALVQNDWGDWVAFIKSAKNGGFAHGNNLGISYVFCKTKPPEFVLLLNPDTVVKPGAIGLLKQWIFEHSKVGVVGARLLDAAGLPQCSGFRFPSVLGELESGVSLGVLTRLLSRYIVPMPIMNSPVAVDWVSGACLLIRSSVIEQIGLLDENYFMYYEEVDFCRRAAHRGWQVWHLPQAEVLHLEGAASGITDLSKSRPRYWYDSRMYYFLKHHGRMYALIAESAYLFGLLTWRTRRMVQRKADCSIKHRFSDGWRFVIHPLLSGILIRKR